MIDTVEKPSPLQGYIDKWLAAQPQQHVALMFVDGRRYPGHLALAAFEQEMLDAAYGLREPQATIGKLNWWMAELTAAPTTGGQHPLTKVLFDDDRALAIPSAVWLAPARAAIAQLEQGTAADFPAQLAAARPLHGALAALETVWWYGAQASAERATQVAILGHLLHALRRLQQDVDRDRLPVPMARLAQHGLNREQLRQSGAACTQAVKAQLHDLLRSWQEAGRQPGPLSVFRAVESRHGRRLARRAAGAADAMAVLGVEQVRPSMLSTLHAWHAARVWLRACPPAARQPVANGAAPD
jgi:phytoene synthase